MCTLLTAYADFLAQAQTICDLYHEPLRPVVSIGERDGKNYLMLSASYTARSFNSPATVPVHVHESEATALAELAKLLDVANPFAVVALVTKAQREELVRLLNDVRITRMEKAKQLLRSVNYTEAQAEEAIAEVKQIINERAGHAVYAEVAQYGVVAEAFQVAVA